MTQVENIEHPTEPAGERPTAQLVPILTVAERAALLECESIIRQGRAVFVQVGHALSRIRDSRLYREGYNTFEEYCLAEWEISDRYARNVRSAADVVEALRAKQFAVLPATESQARPLTKLPREECGPAWEEVLADGVHADGHQRVTASRVAEVVQRRMNRIRGKDSDTELVSKGQGPKSKVDSIDTGTREERILVATAEAQGKLRELAELMVTADSSAAANVVVAIHNLDDLGEHIKRVQKMQSNRKAVA